MSKILNVEKANGLVIISTQGYLNKDLGEEIQKVSTEYVDKGSTSFLLNLSQSNINISQLVRIGRFYEDTDKEALYCDMFAGAITDFAEASMQAAFQPTKEIAVKMLKERFNKFAPKFELRIKENGNEFCVGKKISFADVILTEALSAYLEWIPDLLKNTPLLSSIYEKVINQTGIKLYLSSELRYPIPDEKYVIDVARVLQRALPTHMSDINRFVN